MTTAAAVRDQINAALGTQALTLGNDPSYKVTYTTTGLLPMDILLQGGIPRGRHVEFYGDYSTLKSFVGYNAIAQHQAQGKLCGLMDAEHAWDASWGDRIGVDSKNLLFEQPASGEEAIDTVEAMIRAGVDFLMIDSVATLLPEAEQEKRLSREKIQPGRQAALMSAALRKITAAMKHTSVLWINQTRMSIGVTFGNPESIPGGKSLPFYASNRVDMRKAGKVTEGFKTYDGEKWVDSKLQTGQKYKATVTKSKLSRPFREIWFLWDLNSGSIDIPTFCMAQGLELGLIQQKGASWNYDGFKAVGREKFRDKLAGDPEALSSLENAIRGYYDLPVLKSPQKAVQRQPDRTTKTRQAATRKKPSTSRGGLVPVKKRGGALKPSS